jgi:PhoH-like ATPase
MNVLDQMGLEFEHEEGNDIYSGYQVFDVLDSEINKFYEDDFYQLPEELAEMLQINEYFIMRSELNFSKTCIGKFNGIGREVKKLETSKEKYSMFGIRPKNVEQIFCIDALLDPTIQIVSIIGKAGCGKTLLAIAAGVQQVFGKYGSEKCYDKIIISRPIQPMGNDIGFLPGTMEEKMSPWIQPIMDNLEVLTGNDKVKIKGWFEKEKIEIEAPTYIRGRSIRNAFIILDEAQNLSRHEIKTILTRLGEGSKIILTGDIEQIDNPKLDMHMNGLTHAVEALKEFELTGHVTLRKSERSRVAELCAKVL